MPGPVARRKLLLAFVWILAIVASLPFLFRWQAPPPATGTAALFRTGAGYVLVLALCYAMVRTESRRLVRRQALALVFLILLLTKITNRVHEYTVDYGPNAFGSVTNTAWQNMLQDNVIQRIRFDAPHAARFLPNSVVRWLQLGGWSFPEARDLYRLLFGMLLFYCIYRYARVFTGHAGAIIALLLTAVIYPITFQYYVGQLTDPMSHLSFVLAFLFIEREDFPFLLTTLVIGALAKESVLAMAGYYVLFGRKDKQYPAKVAVLVVCCTAVYFGVRVFCTRRIHGLQGYQRRYHRARDSEPVRFPLALCVSADGVRTHAHAGARLETDPRDATPAGPLFNCRPLCLQRVL